MVIKTSKLNKSLIHEKKSEGLELRAGCSITVAQLLRYCGQNGLSGLEFLVGVPGNVGGVLTMNAGTKTGEAAVAIESLDTFHIETHKISHYEKRQMSYSYRCQHFLSPQEIILEGRFKVTEENPQVLQTRISKMLSDRKATQPLDKPSCGSVFKNPDPAKGLWAWKLIADAGLRGERRGQAQISEVHTNFIINLGGAKSSDVKELIKLAKETVQNRFGVLLEEEVKIVPYSQHP